MMKILAFLISENKNLKRKYPHLFQDEERDKRTSIKLEEGERIITLLLYTNVHYVEESDEKLIDLESLSMSASEEASVSDGDMWTIDVDQVDTILQMAKQQTNPDNETFKEIVLQ